MSRHLTKLGNLFQNLVNLFAEGIFFVTVALLLYLVRTRNFC
jgi:hypothetical protein